MAKNGGAKGGLKKLDMSQCWMNTLTYHTSQTTWRTSQRYHFHFPSWSDM